MMESGHASSSSPVSWAALALCVLGIVGFQWLVAGKPRGAAVGVLRGGDRSKLHARRKLQHAITGVLIYAATAFFPTSVGSAVLLEIALAFLCVHALRKRNAHVDRWFIESYYGILRREEVARKVLPGSFFFLLGAALALAVFPRPIARLALLHLSVGDPAGSLTGILFGRHKLSKLIGRRAGNKSVEGALGCLLVSSIATFVAVHGERQCYDPLVLRAGVSRVFLSIVAGVSAAIGEAIHLGCDDNLSLPLVSGLLLQVVTMVTS